MRILLGKDNYTKYSMDQWYKKISTQNPGLIKRVKENINFKDIHKDKRCFILGNGPSLKEQDLSLLKDEYVFTVNQIAKHKDFDKLKTNYHFWADPTFFKLDKDKPEDMQLLETMLNVKTGENNPVCFFASDAYDFVNEFELDKKLDIKFYVFHQSITDHMNEKIDFTKLVPGFHTVVQYAIWMAIYMGFSEIYILGCETTSILTSVNVRLNENLDNDYAYEISEKEKKRMLNRTNVVSFEDELFSFYHVVKDYRLIYEYCKKNSIHIANCTPGGLIESFPRKKYEHVIGGKYSNE